MPYEQLGIAPDGVKKNRWKDRGGDQGIETSWTIDSTFGVGDSIKVTLILENHKTMNTFYTKHVLREGESKEKIHAIRNARKDLTAALDQGGSAQDVRRAAARYSASQNSMFMTTATTSSFIDLNKINLKLMLYRMAEKLAAVKDQIPLDENTDVIIDFQKDCVIDTNGMASSDTMIIGVRKITDDGDGRVTFDINHCAEGSRNYI